MNKILVLLKNLWANSKLAIIAITCAVSLFLLNKYNYQRYQNQLIETQRVQANLNAFNDTLRVTKNKAGKLEYDKLAYISKTKNLEEDNRILSELVNDVKGDVKFIVKTTTKIVHDTLKLPATLDTIGYNYYITSHLDSTYSPGNYRRLSFSHSINMHDFSVSGQINNDEIGFTAVTGLKKTDKGYEIFVTPNYPRMTLTGLEGAVIGSEFFKTQTTTSAKTSAFSLGVHIGYSPFNYDLGNKKLDFTQRVVFSGGLNVDLIKLLSITKN